MSDAETGPSAGQVVALDPLTLPLQGCRLIEASAGTGKTWTIAALVLRWVLGHGVADDPASSQPPLQRSPLLPSQILVVTFTRAATRELSGRIRSRLVQATRVFRAEEQLGPGDSFLSGLLACYADGAARLQAASLLAQAADAMDEAAVYTLDAWCQRIVREWGAQMQVPDAVEFAPDSLDSRLSAARDVWRQSIQPLRGPALDTALALWPQPDKLASDAAEAEEAALDEALGLQLSANAPMDDLAVHVERYANAMVQLKHEGAVVFKAMRAWLGTQLERADKPLKLPPKRVQGWLDKLDDWAASPMATLSISDAARRDLCSAGIRAAADPKRAQAAVPPAFEQFDALLAQLDAGPQQLARLRALAVLQVRAQLSRLKVRQQRFSHADAQRWVADALDPARGQSARQLQTLILQRWPVALVDEFQDTSPRQLKLLERSYGMEANASEQALFLIGDPKQSIYSFRGADIHSYLQARRATVGRHHALAKNHRSATGLVQALNGLFGAAQDREPSGAFRLDDPAATRRVMPFFPVAAQGRADQLQLSGQDAPAIELSLDAQPMPVGLSRQLGAKRCAQTLVSWLNDPATGMASGTGEWRRLLPQDVAILVRNQTEAALILQALALRGVPAVYLSQRDSVFASAEAEGVRWWLLAAAEPQNHRAIRTAMASALNDEPVADWLARADDEQRLSQASELWHGLHQIWLRQGVLAMLRRALIVLGAAQRWMARSDAQRRLTNVMHLAELLQSATQASGLVAGADTPAALLRWYERQLQAAQLGLADTGSADERVLRLERDEQAVRVITVHKSKGLEFAVVMLPFATQVRKPRGQGQQSWLALLPDATGQRRAVLAPDEHALQQQRLEASREELRLLYVALTRARNHLWLGISLQSIGKAPAPVWHASALGYLLTGPEPVSREQAAHAVRSWAQGSSAVHCTEVLPQTDPAKQAPLNWVSNLRVQALRPLETYRASFNTHWSISSYSKLLLGKDSASGRQKPGSSLEDTAADETDWSALSTLRQDEPDGGPSVPSQLARGRKHGQELALEAPSSTAAGASASTSAPWHLFPKGALAGHFLHGQLEWLAGEQFALPNNEVLRAVLLKRCEREAWGHHGDSVVQWLSALCELSLPPLGATVQTLRSPLPEMEFWLPLQRLDPVWLDQQCTRHLFEGQARPPLGERVLEGLLMGFADLVFEHAGRAWVLDYKSNVLGPDDAAYRPQSLVQSMLEHRYDVQAALYALAVHRLMRSRMGDRYAPQSHLGGAIFWFLRGVAAPSAGCCHLTMPVALLDALDGMLEPMPIAGDS